MNSITTFDLQKLFKETELDNFYTNMPPPLNSGQATFCLYGRNGLFAIAEQIKNLQPSKPVALVPAYSCGDEIESIKNAGFTTIIYNIKPNLQIDFEDLEKKFSSETGLVLITHYLGFPQLQMNDIKELTKQNQSFLIEDCAHSMGSQFDGISAGVTGDASVFSFRKFMDIPHGGAVLINNPQLSTHKFEEPSSQAISIELFLFLGQKNKFFPPGTPIKDIYNQVGLDYPSSHGPRLGKYGGYNLGISNLAKYVALKTDINGLIENRRANFLKYLNLFKQTLKNQDSLIFADLPKGVVPSFFPLLVKNSEKCNSFLNEQGLSCTQPFWSYLHEHVGWEAFPDTKQLKTQMLVIPLTRTIPEDELQKLALLLQSWSL